MNVAEVEDGWANGDIRRGEMVQNGFPPLSNGVSAFSAFPLGLLLAYWRKVEQTTRANPTTCDVAALEQTVSVEDCPASDSHSADCSGTSRDAPHRSDCLLLRAQGVKPPPLDLLFYL